MKLSSTKLKVFGGWIVVLMCIMAFSSKVLGSESIPKERENYQFTERSVPLKSGKAQVRKYRKRSSRNPVGIINISKLPARTRVAKINAQNSPANLFGFLAATIIVMKRGIMVSTRLILIQEIILNCMM